MIALVFFLPLAVVLAMVLLAQLESWATSLGPTGVKAHQRPRPPRAENPPRRRPETDSPHPLPRG